MQDEACTCGGTVKTDDELYTEQFEAEAYGHHHRTTGETMKERAGNLFCFAMMSACMVGIVVLFVGLAWKLCRSMA